MSEQKALYLESPNGEWRITSKPIPKPGPGELLVKIHATALNTADWKIHDFFDSRIQDWPDAIEKIGDWFVPEWPAVLGTDAAGTVEELGEGVRGFEKGDRVLHQGFYMNDKATFQQYTLVPAEIAARIPSNVSFFEAASVPVALAAAAVGLYGERPTGVQKYKPAWEEDGQGLYRRKPIIVFGGSTSVGQYVIQLARLSGFSPIITTASRHNSGFLKMLGAAHVIDRQADVPSEVSNILAGRRVEFIYDAVSQQDTQTQAWDLLSPGGTLLIVLPAKVDKRKYENKILIDNMFANFHLPPLRRIGASLYSKLTSLLESGAIMPNRIDVLPNGLAGIPDGLDRLRKNKVSGMKLIARPQETS